LPVRLDLPHHAARQIAEALQHMPNRPVEITLSPEELGRVRMGVSASEGNILVAILAERPETIDLLRRNIAALEAAFQELGYSNINFEFAGGENAQSNSDEGKQNRTEPPDNWLEKPQTAAVQVQLKPAALSGLDIRL
jgi:flagellar hook-length control protein FliK